MEIKSKFLGEQQVNPDTIIHFPQGIPGFEDQTQFKLFHSENDPVIFWLQSVDDDELTFSVAQPIDFNINYSFMLTDEDEEILQLQDLNDLLILIMLHKDQSDEHSRPTIKGSIKSPLLINTVQRIGIQKNLNKIDQSITLTEQRNENEIHVIETE